MTFPFQSVPVAPLTVAIIASLMLRSTPPQAPPPADPPSLDEALGIGGESKDRSAEQRKSELERSLDGAKPRDILASAIDDMRQSARLLGERESGLAARRVQESVVRKLDELIASAQRMQQQQQQQQQQSASGQQQQRNNQSKGKSGQEQGEDGEREEPREDGQERGGRDGTKQEGKDGQRSRNAGESDANEPPPTQDATAQDAQFDEGRAEWGRLPPRVREAVRQGFRDPMSSAYRRLTQEYYRRLAEERKR